MNVFNMNPRRPVIESDPDPRGTAEITFNFANCNEGGAYSSPIFTRKLTSVWIDWRMTLSYQSRNRRDRLYVGVAVLDTIMLKPLDFRVRVQVMDDSEAGSRVRTRILKPRIGHPSERSFNLPDTATLTEIYITVDFEVINESGVSHKVAQGLINDLTMLHNQCKLRDVKLVCAGDDIIKAHKAVIAARSGKFNLMFKCGEDIEEAPKMDTIQIEDVDGATMKRMVKFMYTGTVESDEYDILLDLMKAARLYRVENLVEQCSFELYNLFTPDNLSEIFTVANKYEIDNLRARLLDFVVRNRDAVESSDSWRSYLRENPKILALINDYGAEVLSSTEYSDSLSESSEPSEIGN